MGGRAQLAVVDPWRPLSPMGGGIFVGEHWRIVVAALAVSSSRCSCIALAAVAMIACASIAVSLAMAVVMLACVVALQFAVAETVARN